MFLKSLHVIKVKDTDGNRPLVTCCLFSKTVARLTRVQSVGRLLFANIIINFTSMHLIYSDYAFYNFYRVNIKY